MKHLKSFLIPLGILILIKLLFWGGFFARFEHITQDTLFRIRGQQNVTGEVVIVGVDDETFSALEKPWPFERSYHAKLIENLNRAGARLIVFDIEFTEPSDAHQDGALAQAAAEYQNVVFAGKVIESFEGGFHQQLYSPISAITNQDLSWGLVNLGTDSDGVMRSYDLFHKYDKEQMYTLGVAALGNYRVYQPDWSHYISRKEGKLMVADKKIPIMQHNKALINYFGDAQSFPYYPYSKILDDSTMAMPGFKGMEFDDFEEILANGELRDKIVLIGANTAELHDYFATPFSSKELTPGVEIHANFIEMVLQGKYLSHINLWLFLGIEILITALFWVIFKKLKPQLGIILLVLLLIAHFGIAYFAFSRGSLIIPIVQMMLLLTLLYIAGLVRHYLESQKEKKFIRNAFQQYMAPELVDKLLKDPGSLKYGGSLQEVTVLFSDVRSFTTYSEKHSPEETVQILKEYLTEMIKTIVANEGILDKFVGDAIMALFGTPVALENPALNACKTALDMIERLHQLQNKWQAEGRQIFEIGIGINTGEAIVGNLGSEQIFDYTAIGDTINLGSRLESINKDHKTTNHIIISEFTYEKVKEQVNVRYIDEVTVKGKQKPIKIYELLSLR